MMEELATFAAVVRCGSMSRAAQELHLSQPAISQRLRSLESRYSISFLRRTNRGVELTPAGEVMAKYARRLLTLDQGLHDELDALRAAEPRQVVIGATSAIGGYALPCTIYLFQQKNPTARIQLVIGKRADILQRLGDGALDLALIEGPNEPESTDTEGWHTTVVSEEDLIVITPATGALSQPECFTVDDLVQAPLILRERGSGCRQVVEQAFGSAGVSPGALNLAMELTSLDAIKTSVAQGHGVSIVSRWAVKAELRMGTLRTVPLKGIQFHSYWTLISPRNNQQVMLLKKLLRTLRSPAERGFC